MAFSLIRLIKLFVGLTGSLLLLSACKSDMANHLKPLSYAMVSRMEKLDMKKSDPIYIRLFKKESELEVWKKTKSGKYALLKTYDICKWSGELGPKIKEGDRQAPEGFYTIRPSQMNPNSSYHLSFNMGFPNSFDRAHGRTGSHLMVHGACSSRGCYAMEDEQIQEIYALGRDAFIGGQRAFDVHAFPFRMTPENMAEHHGNQHFAFWQMLKDGYDHFEVSHMPPKVDVCGYKYVFDAKSPGSFLPTSTCPSYTLDENLQLALAAKRQKDEQRFDIALAKLKKAGGATQVAAVSGKNVPPSKALPIESQIDKATTLSDPLADDVESATQTPAIPQTTAVPAPTPRAAPETPAGVIGTHMSPKALPQPSERKALSRYISGFFR